MNKLLAFRQLENQSRCYLICTLALVFAIFYVPPIQANTTKDLACVQHQLAKLLGEDQPFDVEQLKQSYQRWRSSIDHQTLPSELTLANAVLICRINGQIDPKLKVYWYGLKQRFEVLHPEGLDQNLVKQTKDVLVQTLANNLTFNGIRFVRPVPVIVGTTASDLEPYAKDLMANLFNQTVFDEIADFSCGSEIDVVSGFVYGQAIYLCFEDQDMVFTTEHLRIYDEEVAHRRMLVERMLAHELFHIYQREAIGYDITLDAQMPHNEEVAMPAWLVEGTAMLAGIFAYNRDFKLEKAAWDRLMPLMKMPLKDMESANSYERHGEKLYEQGFVASALLLEEHGRQSIETFFAHVGLGEPWRVAFEKSFGITSGVFYSRVDTM